MPRHMNMAIPHLNPDLLSILIKFRLNEIAFMADMKKTFLHSLEGRERLEQRLKDQRVEAVLGLRRTNVC